MTIGYLGAGVCWSSVTDAIDAHYESLPVLSNMTGYGSAVYQGVFAPYRVSPGVWAVKGNFCTSAAVCSDFPVVNLPSAVYASCTLLPSSDPEQQFIDGHILGWGVVIAMVAAWSIHALRRAI